MICFPSKDNCGKDSPLKSSFVLNQLMALLTCLKGGKVWGSAPYYDANTENVYVHISQVPLVFSLGLGVLGFGVFICFWFEVFYQNVMHNPHFI